MWMIEIKEKAGMFYMSESNEEVEKVLRMYWWDWGHELDANLEKVGHSSYLTCLKIVC